MDPVEDIAAAYRKLLDGAASHAGLEPLQEALNRDTPFDLDLPGSVGVIVAEALRLLKTGFLVGIDKSQAFRFFPYDRLEWEANAWPFNMRPPVYKYLFQGSRSSDYSLDPQPAIAFAASVARVIQGAWLRATWSPVVSRWDVTRLFATAGVRFAAGIARASRAAIEKVLTRMEKRKDSLPTDFERLYYQRSKKVWKRTARSE